MKSKPLSKRLLIVIDFPHVGGAERVALQIATHIDIDLFTPIFIAPEEGNLRRELDRLGIRAISLDLERLKRTCRYLIPVFFAIRDLIKIVKRERIDVIHANSLWALKFCTVASFLTKVPTVAMIHAYPKIHSRAKRLFHLLTRRFCYKRAKRIIAVSNALRQALIADKAPSEKIVVIPNGIEKDWFSDKVDLPKGKTKMILTVGRLHPGKGQQVFLRAAAMVHAKHPNTRFVIAGDEYRTSLENLGFAQELIDLAKQLSISECVEFVGYTNNLRDLYRQSSIVVLASFEETFGMVALEAMAAARPIIASRIPGITELVRDGETGLLFEAGKHEQLAESLISLLEDGQLARKLARGGLEAAKAEFSLERTISQLRAVFSLSSEICSD
ncbi:MAG: glycosyltransferase family 4 protein [Candidatus Coatesbacteria bacterium]|nr:glycosyltransferase family 4 protein [Candidatus Coatesbacteria bacterium]